MKRRVPDNLTPEEREARIAELRARRRARMRTLAIRSAIGTGGIDEPRWPGWNAWSVPITVASSSGSPISQR